MHEAGNLDPARRFEDPGGAVIAGGCDEMPVWAEGDSIHAALMCQPGDSGARFRVEDARGLVLTSGGHVASVR